MATMPNGMTTGGGEVQEHEPIWQTKLPFWQTKLPFEIQSGDGALIAKAMRAYRPETSEEESVVSFFIEQFEKLDQRT